VEPGHPNNTPDDQAASRNSLSRALLRSQSSVVALGPTVRDRQLTLRLPSFRSSRWASSVSLSCPQIPPLDFDDEVIEYFTSNTSSVDPSPPLSTRASVLSVPSSMPSGHNFRTGSRNGTQATTASFISTASGESSPLEVALSTPTSMLCSRGSPRVIKTGTMEGLVRHLLLNPAGEQLTTYQRAWD
jgi:hypothetical protein